MLSRSRRLRTAEVAEVMRRGKSSRGRFMSAKAVSDAGGTIRAAAVVPKSLVKKAVLRNRIRRALYRAVASLPAEVTAGKSAQVVFFVRTVPPSPLTPALAADITDLLSALPKKS